MRRVIYASSAAENLQPSELDKIAEVSRHNNARDGITGMMLYGDQSFFQVLEGPDDQAIALLERIRADPRHQGLIEMKNEAIDSVAFPDWSMGCYRVDGAGAGSGIWKIAGLESILERLPDSVPPDVIILARTFFNSVSPRR